VERPALAAILVLAFAAASARAQDGLGPEDRATLLVDPASPALQSNEKLRQRLARGPHDYFRYLNGPFREVLCRHLSAGQREAASVTLHGDPHLEQYAVTERGRGLADFDDATFGPAVLDLVRFATSLRLVARDHGWKEDEVVGVFLQSYAGALRNPPKRPPEPAVAARMRAGFVHDRRQSLARSVALMEPLPPEAAPDQSTLDRTAEILARVSGWPKAFFKIKQMGLLRIGIGSAGDEKYLLRVEGHAPADADDVILEVKEVRPSPAARCVRSDPGPDRILLGSARLAYEPFEYAGGITLEDRSFWFHAWPDNYAEMDFRKDLRSPADLDEIARDVGLQLGWGHPRTRKGKDSKELRETLLKQLSSQDVATLSATMAEGTVEAWQRYRQRLGN
jgi:hypothetical protein